MDLCCSLPVSLQAHKMKLLENWRNIWHWRSFICLVIYTAVMSIDSTAVGGLEEVLAILKRQNIQVQVYVPWFHPHCKHFLVDKSRKVSLWSTKKFHLLWPLIIKTAVGCFVAVGIGKSWIRSTEETEKLRIHWTPWARVDFPHCRGRYASLQSALAQKLRQCTSYWWEGHWTSKLSLNVKYCTSFPFENILVIKYCCCALHLIEDSTSFLSHLFLWTRDLPEPMAYI